MTDLVKTIGMDDGWEIVPKTGEFKASKLPVGLWVKELKKLKQEQYEEVRNVHGKSLKSN